MTAAELLILAQTYSKATGMPLTTLGQRACADPSRRHGNDKIFTRLEQGYGCHSTSLERAAAWFYANWPEGLAWPRGVPRRRCAA